MIYILLTSQEALQATEALRGDPLLYVLISFMGAAVIGLTGAIMYLFKRNSSLQDLNTELAKAGTEAIAAFTPLMQGMDRRMQETFLRIESTFNKAVDDIKGHINILKKLD